MKLDKLQKAARIVGEGRIDGIGAFQVYKVHSPSGSHYFTGVAIGDRVGTFCSCLAGQHDTECNHLLAAQYVARRHSVMDAAAMAVRRTCPAALDEAAEMAIARAVLDTLFVSAAAPDPA